jgi:hypothetical protein
MYKCLLEYGNDRINEKDKIGKKDEERGGCPNI